MLLISGLCDYFTLFHYFTLQDKYGWLIRFVWDMGYWQLDMDDWRKGKNWQNYYKILLKLVSI